MPGTSPKGTPHDDESPTGVRPIRVAVVDDHQVVVDGLEAMLRPHSARVEVVGRTTDAAQAMELMRRVRPDLCILDVRMNGASGLDLCAELRRETPDSRVVFLTVYDDEHYLFQALQLGASGYLLKGVVGAELVDYLERVMEGDTVVDPIMAGRVAVSAARLRRGEFWPGAHLGLTRRESEVLGFIVRGLSTQAIADELRVGKETVKTHVRHIYRKLEVTDRGQAVAVALREGLAL